MTPRLTPLLPTLVPVCHRVDNNHLLLLMIHVFRENEEQLFKVSPRSGEPSRDAAKAGWDTHTPQCVCESGREGARADSHLLRLR